MAKVLSGVVTTVPPDLLTPCRYGWLDTRWPVAATARVILLKTVLDQTLLTIPLLLVFFPYMSWCQGQQVSGPH